MDFLQMLSEIEEKPAVIFGWRRNQLTVNILSLRIRSLKAKLEDQLFCGSLCQNKLGLILTKLISGV